MQACWCQSRSRATISGRSGHNPAVAERAKVVEFIFKDEAFKFETLRAAGFAGDAGADIGEVIATPSRIVEGDERVPHDPLV